MANGGPAPQGIVVAVDDERPDTVPREPFDPAEERQLGPDPALLAIVKVAREDDERSPAFESQIDDGSKRSERSVAKERSGFLRHLSKPGEWGIQVEIGGVDEAEPHMSPMAVDPTILL
jgi:hypothetical protein